jgi:hypothetical protein
MAYTFHWPPESLLAMTADDLDFWSECVEDLRKLLKKT